MLMLLFQIGDAPWAIAAAEVKDLIPLVTLQPHPGVCLSAGKSLSDRASWDGVSWDVGSGGGSGGGVVSSIAGLLNYHGEYIPVIDVAQSVAHQHAPSILSTRIAIVEAVVEPVRNGKALFQKRGLILDRAYETAYLSKTVDLPGDNPYVSATLAGDNGVVQQLAVSRFF